MKKHKKHNKFVSFIKEWYPIIKDFLEPCLKHTALVVGMALVTGITTLYQHFKKPDPSYLGTTWVGKNMMDAHNEIYQNKDMIFDLSNRVSQLEH